jgi:hypothetical protein
MNSNQYNLMHENHTFYCCKELLVHVLVYADYHILCCYFECNYAELSVIILNVIIPNVVIPNVVILNVVI